MFKTPSPCDSLPNPLRVICTGEKRMPLHKRRAYIERWLADGRLTADPDILEADPEHAKLSLPLCVFRGEISNSQCECLCPQLTAPLNQVVPLAKCDGCKFASTTATVTRKRRWKPRDNAGLQPEPCIYRGEQLRTEECRPCAARGNETTVSVLKCEVHNECTLRPHKLAVRGKMIPNCLQCDERQNPGKDEQ